MVGIGVDGPVELLAYVLVGNHVQCHVKSLVLQLAGVDVLRTETCRRSQVVLCHHLACDVVVIVECGVDAVLPEAYVYAQTELVGLSPFEVGIVESLQHGTQ